MLGSGGAYHKIERKVGDYATAGVAVQLTIQNNVCTYIGISLTNRFFIAAKRAQRSEALLKGKTLNDALIEESAQYASEDCSPSSDLRGSEEYKRAMVKELYRMMPSQCKEQHSE